MYFVDKILAQGTRQRKIPVPKKFWIEFPLNSYIKISLLDDNSMFFVDRVQAQGNLQRRIPVPQKFWDKFSVGATVKIEVMKRGGELQQKNACKTIENYFVDKIQAQGKRQRKIPVSKKFWVDFPLNSMVKIELLDDDSMFFVDRVQAQGKLQRRIPVPQKFWEEFPVGATVRIEIMKKGKKR